jgi:hypothetical protein
MTEVCSIAKEHFGITKDIKEAGFILENGTMLDFSGRHNAVGYKNKIPDKDDYLKGQRGTDHREIKDIFSTPKAGTNGTEEMIGFMRDCKAIRVSGLKDSLNLDFIKNISKEQEELLRHFEGREAYVDIDDLNGIAVCSKEFDDFNVPALKRMINECSIKIHSKGHIIIKNE